MHVTVSQSSVSVFVRPKPNEKPVRGSYLRRTCDNNVKLVDTL